MENEQSARRRNVQPKQEARIKTIKAHEEESSDEIELISNNQVDEVEDEQKKHEDVEKDQKAGETLKTLKDLIKAAEENEDILEGQNQDIAVMLEDLDEKRLEEFVEVLNKFRANVELKNKNKKLSGHIRRNQRHCQEPKRLQRRSEKRVKRTTKST